MHKAKPATKQAKLRDVYECFCVDACPLSRFPPSLPKKKASMILFSGKKYNSVNPKIFRPKALLSLL